MHIEVVRPITGAGGETIPAGTILDASSWRPSLLKGLLTMRRVVPAGFAPTTALEMDYLPKKQAKGATHAQ